MNRHVLFASVALFSFAVAAPAFALNPQPEPPGRSKMLHNQKQHTAHTIGSATGGAGAGKSTFGPTTGGGGSGKVVVMRKAGGTQMNSSTSAAATHGFNPQPDPPGDKQTQTQTQH